MKYYIDIETCILIFNFFPVCFHQVTTVREDAQFLDKTERLILKSELYKLSLMLILTHIVKVMVTVIDLLISPPPPSSSPAPAPPP